MNKLSAYDRVHFDKFGEQVVKVEFKFGRHNSQVSSLVTQRFSCSIKGKENREAFRLKCQKLIDELGIQLRPRATYHKPNTLMLINYSLVLEESITLHSLCDVKGNKIDFDVDKANAEDLYQKLEFLKEEQCRNTTQNSTQDSSEKQFDEPSRKRRALH